MAVSSRVEANPKQSPRARGQSDAGLKGARRGARVRSPADAVRAYQDARPGRTATGRRLRAVRARAGRNRPASRFRAIAETRARPLFRQRVSERRPSFSPLLGPAAWRQPQTWPAAVRVWSLLQRLRPEVPRAQCLIICVRALPRPSGRRRRDARPHDVRVASMPTAVIKPGRLGGRTLDHPRATAPASYARGIATIEERSEDGNDHSVSIAYCAAAMIPNPWSAP